MSTSIPAESSRSRPARTRRSIMACARCRQRKVRCVAAEQPPKSPCTRCIKRHLTCEYVAVVPKSDDASGLPSEASSSADVSSPTPDLPIQTWAAGPRPTFLCSQQRDRAPPLPYTHAPPPNRRRFINSTRHLMQGRYPAVSNFSLAYKEHLDWHGPQMSPTHASSGNPSIQMPYLQSPYVVPPPDAYSLQAAHCARQYLTNLNRVESPSAHDALRDPTAYADYLEPPFFEETFVLRHGLLASPNTQWVP
ncbi:hypothetical protein C8F04DRAFT_1234766 [Mycena alexandri]|uniref:Zn(2)-C6 fungal-type domain-containing protein n=1 Tax=Mycena alexandri TaxID=1745969 RepID=A0AAD6SXJ7_9AGAR|nr:hypothetical protein C8F04DRAFT_1234766 [Mycena alexandri]